jgi:hypothetical protein
LYAPNFPHVRNSARDSRQFLDLIEAMSRHAGQTFEGRARDRWPSIQIRLHAEADFSDVRELTSAMREELEKFIATDDLEDKQLEITGWKGQKAALKAIKQGAKSFQRDD